mgnify:CR=1 FL=1
MPIYKVQTKRKSRQKKGLDMRIENEMVKRFNQCSSEAIGREENDLSMELDIFFDNVLDTVVDYFKEGQEVLR